MTEEIEKSSTSVKLKFLLAFSEVLDIWNLLDVDVLQIFPTWSEHLLITCSDGRKFWVEYGHPGLKSGSKKISADNKNQVKSYLFLCAASSPDYPIVPSTSTGSTEL